MEKYNVYLINSETFEANKRLATYVSIEQAARFDEVTAEAGFFIASFPVKSDRDLELRNDLIALQNKEVVFE